MAEVSYIAKPIDREWVESGAAFYITLSGATKKHLHRIIPSDMDINFYVGLAHGADDSAIGCVICHIICERNAISEFVQNVNELVAKIGE
jgi:hypothetical protein